MADPQQPTHPDRLEKLRIERLWKRELPVLLLAGEHKVNDPHIVNPYALPKDGCKLDVLPIRKGVGNEH